MIPIRKNKEPDSLTEFRLKNSGFHYSDGLPADVSTDLKESLCREQGYICAYCMSRIYPKKTDEKNGMRVEHWTTQSSSPEKSLDYGNMLGVCNGQYGSAFTCDNYRGKAKYGDNGPLKYNPAFPADSARLRISYTADGRIRSDDVEFDLQLETTLNLNNDYLCMNRMAVIDGIIKEFNHVGKSKEVTKERLQKLLRFYENKDESGMLPPFCGVAASFITKRLKRH